MATRERLETAMGLYFEREFDAALALFEAVSQADPHDTVPQLFIERCARYLSEPLGEDWQGFERLLHK